MVGEARTAKPRIRYVLLELRLTPCIRATTEIDLEIGILGTVPEQLDLVRSRPAFCSLNAVVSACQKSHKSTASGNSTYQCVSPLSIYTHLRSLLHLPLLSERVKDPISPTQQFPNTSPVPPKSQPHPPPKMPTAPYLMHINSRPKLVSDEVWQEWYIKEHLPDLVNHGCAVRATFHTEVLSGPTVIDGPSESNPRKYLALYQSDIPECLDTDNYRKGVRKTSELFEKASGIAQDMPNGEFDGRYYKLYETYDPNKLGDGMFIFEVPLPP